MQCEHWQISAGGSFFWNAKMDFMPGGGWGFTEMTNRGCIQSPPYMHWPYAVVRTKNSTAQQQRHYLRNHARLEHNAYWIGFTYSEGCQEALDTYEKGWDQGYTDAASFFMARVRGLVIGATVGADRIGFLSLWWVLKHLGEGSDADVDRTTRRTLEFKIEGPNVWRWRYGFREGVKAYEKQVGIIIPTDEELRRSGMTPPATPGPSSTAPGPSSSAPGPSSSAPGPSSSAPGPSSSAPGPSSSAPGPSSTAPGPSLTAQDFAPKAQGLASKTQGPAPKTQDPAPKAQGSASKTQGPTLTDATTS